MTVAPRFLAFLPLGALLAGPLQAQPLPRVTAPSILVPERSIPRPATIQATGTVESVGEGALLLRQEDESVERFLLPADTVVTRVRPVRIGEIHSGDFISSAGQLSYDGKLHATELRILPPSLRGLNEGQSPMDDARGLTMTNATVTATHMSNDAVTLTLRYGEQQSELVVDAAAPVRRIGPATLGELVAGQAVRVLGEERTEGPTALRVAIQ